MFREFIQSDVLIVHSLIHGCEYISRNCSFLSGEKVLHKLKETQSMAGVAKSRSSLHIEKSDFDMVVLNKIFYLVIFSCINLPLTAKYTSEKLISKLTIFKFYTAKALKNIGSLF